MHSEQVKLVIGFTCLPKVDTKVVIMWDHINQKYFAMLLISEINV